ncbi:MAG: hypothetical protein LBL33_09290 [Tannerella sp.]|jgi:hypothetical protein|nr:hypothetical protein [Tannerella sp.]
MKKYSIIFISVIAIAKSQVKIPDVYCAGGGFMHGRLRRMGNRVGVWHAMPLRNAQNHAA